MNNPLMYHLGVTAGISDAQDGKPFNPPARTASTDFYRGYCIGYESEKLR